MTKLKKKLNCKYYHSQKYERNNLLRKLQETKLKKEKGERQRRLEMITDKSFLFCCILEFLFILTTATKKKNTGKI